jgi:2-polyprenyl-3-methyl-5-hydroxy-6-metoxy-1,4-benzoquinol methylase
MTVSVREANSVSNWDALWVSEGIESWRKTALDEVYQRILQLVPAKSHVIDLGGGVGLLAKMLWRT